MQRKKQFLQDGGDLFITICGIVVILLTAVVLYPLIYVFSASFSSAQFHLGVCGYGPWILL